MTKIERGIFYHPKLGWLEIQSNGSAITGIGTTRVHKVTTNISPVLTNGVEQIKEYLNGQRRSFAFKMDQGGTVFQQKVWRELTRIPYGKTVSYADIAKRIGNPKALRAVGTAIGSNKLAMAVPCHRVINKSGKLGGFAWGLPRKKWLLEHEGQ